jgi:hypothetical protein
LNSAKANGHLRGVAQNEIPGEVSHLQYADDTVLLVQHDEESVMTEVYIVLF